MVERSKKPTRRARLTVHEVAAVLEAMRGENRAVGAGLQSFREEFQSFRRDVGARFDKVDASFDQVDACFEKVDARLAQVDTRFDQVDFRFGRVEHDVLLLKDVVLENTRELKRLTVALDKKVDRDEVEGIVEGVLRRG